MLHMLQAFTANLEHMHQRTLAKHTDMKTAEMEVQMRDEWRRQQVKKRKGNGPLMPCPACEKAGW